MELWTRQLESRLIEKALKFSTVRRIYEFQLQCTMNRSLRYTRIMAMGAVKLGSERLFNERINQTNTIKLKLYNSLNETGVHELVMSWKTCSRFLLDERVFADSLYPPFISNDSSC